MSRRTNDSQKSSSTCHSLWKPPSELTVFQLKLILSKHEVIYNKSKDRKPALIERYTELVRQKAPHELLRWPAADPRITINASIDDHSPMEIFLPSRRLNMSQMREVLTLHAIPHSHARSRASLLDIYESFKLSTLQTADQPEGSISEASSSNHQENDYLGKHLQSSDSSGQDSDYRPPLKQPA